jgi:hypothetical protein
MLYVKVNPDGGAIMYSPTDLRIANPDTSFPAVLTDECLAEWDVYPCQATTPPPVDYTQNLTMGEPVLIDGVWTQTWIVTPASPDEIAEREADMRQANKAQASTLLTETDYTDLPNTADKIVNLGAILAYREVLRIIAINPPLTVEQWPVKPKTQWRSGQ